ncbi:MAG: RHS repeat-associated core domain-containing protein [Porticoccaceae bacterium]|nr:RHS repeat-associated core domain-containing protein [Porticoccaceae bacterium]
MGQRVQKVSLATGIATDYVHNGTNEIAEYADGSLTTRYVYGPGTDETLAQIRYTGTPNNEAETDRRFYYTDGLGSVIATLDSLGNVTKKYSYSPFGINGPGNDHTDQPFGYTGQRYDNDTGLYYYKARYYHAALGRFLSVDPVGYDDQMNLYAYVANRPMGFRDPSGRFQESALNLSTGDFDLWEGDYQDLGDSFLSSVGQQTLNPNPIGRAAAAAQANRDPYAVGLGDFFELLGESAKENLKFGTTLKAAAGPGAGISSLFNANGDTTLNVDYTKGLIFEGGVQFRGDVFSSGTIDGLFQSAEICIAGCIRGAWDYQGNFNIGTRIVIPIAIGGGVSGGYTTSGRSIVDSLSGQ